jgi:AcrR family transcriptional regulator
MPRPRSRSREAVVAVAKDVFWENGYEGTALSELERRTGSNRSSLYAEFGSKQQLFVEALDLYYDEVVDPLISALEAGESLASIGSFFAGVKGLILEQRATDRRGCLLVNTIAELSPHDDATAHRGSAFRDRLLGGFRRALRHEAEAGRIDADSVERRANMLFASTLGIWLSARIDPQDAAGRCDEIAAEVHDWASTSGAGERS